MPKAFGNLAKIFYTKGKRDDKMEKVFIALVDTPGLFAYCIRKVIRRSYIHVALSLDETLTEAYSVGRRHPSIPFFAGFEKEDKYKIHRAFPTARYLIYELDCSLSQKEALREKLREYYRNRFRYHYCILGLPYLLLKRPFYQKRHYTCSSFIARLLSENGIKLFDKHFSLVTPADFEDLAVGHILYEGTLAAFLERGGDESPKQVKVGKGGFRRCETAKGAFI